MPYIGKDPTFLYTYTFGTDTGDASTTAFTITSGRTVEDVLVFVNGFQLTPTTDYTISGTTLTFVTAPGSSAEITYRYLPTTDYTISGTTLTFIAAPANLAEITVRYLRLN